MALLDSTLYYFDSALLCYILSLLYTCPWPYYTNKIALLFLDSTLLSYTLLWLYFTLLHFTLALVASTLLHSTMAIYLHLLTLQWIYLTLRLHQSTTLYYGSTLLLYSQLHSTMAIQCTCPSFSTRYTLRWFYFILLYSTTLYIGSTLLYFIQSS